MQTESGRCSFCWPCETLWLSGQTWHILTSSSKEMTNERRAITIEYWIENILPVCFKGRDYHWKNILLHHAVWISSMQINVHVNEPCTCISQLPCSVVNQCFPYIDVCHFCEQQCFVNWYFGLVKSCGRLLFVTSWCSIDSLCEIFSKISFSANIECTLSHKYLIEKYQIEVWNSIEFFRVDFSFARVNYISEQTWKFMPRIYVMFFENRLKRVKITILSFQLCLFVAHHSLFRLSNAEIFKAQDFWGKAQSGKAPWIIK